MTPPTWEGNAEPEGLAPIPVPAPAPEGDGPRDVGPDGKSWPGSAADWEVVRGAWETGSAWRPACALVDNRVSVATATRRARHEGWERPASEAEQAEGLPGQKPGEGIELAERRKLIAGLETGRKLALRRGELIDAMVDDVLRLRQQVFAPHVVKEAKVVSGPKDFGSSVEIVEIELDEPTPADKQKLVTSMAILVDKLLLLSGEATQRVEQGSIPDREAAEARVKQIRDELAERRAAAEAAKSA